MRKASSLPLFKKYSSTLLSAPTPLILHPYRALYQNESESICFHVGFDKSAFALVSTPQGGVKNRPR